MFETAQREPGRLQPRRRAADGDRLAAGPPLARRRRPSTCGRLRAILRLPRRLRRQHGGGLAALRRQRVAAARRRRRARHEGRDQEHELLPPRAATPSSTRSSARPGRSTRASAIVQETRLWDPDRAVTVLDALEGVRARLPLLPRARPGAAAARPGLGRRDRARRCPSCRAARRQRFVEQYGLPAYDAELLTERPRARRLLRGGGAASTRTRRRWRTGSGPSSCASSRGTPAAVADLARPPGGARAAGRAGRRGHHQRQDGQGLFERMARTGEDARRHRPARGAHARWPTRARSAR